jgi:hypothetical protein
MTAAFDCATSAASRFTMTARLLLLAGASSAALAVTSPVPERLPETRYAKLRAESPFAVATAEAPKEPEKIPWAQNLYIGSVAKLKRTGEEKDWVVIKDRTQPGSLIQLFGNEVNAEGYQLVKLEWADDPRKTKAQVKKGTEFATIEMDQAAFTSSAPPPQPAPAPAQRVAPGAMPAPAPGGVVRPPGTINRPGTPPGMRPPVSIPRPTNLPPTIAQPPAGQGAAAPSNTRSRIRVIPSNP